MKKIYYIVILLFIVSNGFSQEKSTEITGLVNDTIPIEKKAKFTKPVIRWGGLLYTYGFFHSNADFNTSTNDGSSYLYMHGDLHATAEFGHGISTTLSIGAWWQDGLSSVYRGTIPSVSDPDFNTEIRLAASIMEGYIKFENLFGTPFTVKFGKQHMLYGDGAVIFDGGEIGIVGVNLGYYTKYFTAELLYLRNRQKQSLLDVGTGYDTIPNENIIGIYPTVKLFKQRLNLSPYFFLRHSGISPDSTSMPMWYGLRAEGEFGRISARAEFTKMAGSDMYNVNYGGMHYMVAVDYNSKKFMAGAAYVSFSGNKSGTTVNERYESATQGPYTFGFYKGWPGYGPAHVMNSVATFELLNPGIERGPSNQNVLNVHLGATLNNLMLRADYFKYNRNQVSSGMCNDMGSEISLLVKYKIKRIFDIGLTVGDWFSGSYQKEQLPAGTTPGNVIGGYLFISKSF